MPFDYAHAEPYYHEDQTDLNHEFYMNRYNRRHLYIQVSGDNNAIFQAGDYRTVNVPPRQWVYWPYPETFGVKQLLPTTALTISSFATDEVISELGRYGEGYLDYAKAQQAFSAYVRAEATSTHWVGIEIGNTASSTANIILDKAWVISSTLPTLILVTQGPHDTNLSSPCTAYNHRVDASTNGVVAQAQVFCSSDTASITGNANSVQITPATNYTDVLQGTIREVPKMFAGAIGIYAQSADATKFISINIAWHEELC